MNKQPFTVHVPASTANLGPGFDCLGLALGLWNTATFSFETKQFLFEIKGQGEKILSRGKDNLIYRSMERLAMRRKNHCRKKYTSPVTMQFLLLPGSALAQEQSLLV